jgi:hypothetical protein
LAAASAVAGRVFLPDIHVLGVIGFSNPTRAPDASQEVYQSIVGRYYSDADAAQFLDFRVDGTVFISAGGGTASYAVDGATVVISTALAGSARGSIPWTVSTPIYTGVSYQRIFFASGGSTIQRALTGGWNRHG